MLRHVAIISVLSGLIAAAPATAYDKPEDADLFSLKAGSAAIEDGTLTLEGIGDTVLWFAERPVRDAGRMTVDDLIAIWSQGADSFAADPPNGVIAGTADGAEQQYVIEIMEPRRDGDALVFTVTGVGLELPAALTLDEASLFVDCECEFWSGN